MTQIQDDVSHLLRNIENVYDALADIRNSCDNVDQKNCANEARKSLGVTIQNLHMLKQSM